MRDVLPRLERHLDRKNGMIQDSGHMFCFLLERYIFHVK